MRRNNFADYRGQVAVSTLADRPSSGAARTPCDAKKIHFLFGIGDRGCKVEVPEGRGGAD
jgi:hypothetical protein